MSLSIKDRASLVHVYAFAEAAQPQTVTIDQVLESDLAQGLATVIAIAQVSESDLAQEIEVAGPQIIAVDQITESDAAQVIFLPSSSDVIGYTEDGYLVFGSGHDEIGRLVVDSLNHLLEDGTIYVAVEAGVSLVAQAVETDIAQTIIRYGVQSISIGQALESEFASRLATFPLGQSKETDGAQAVWVPGSIGVIGYTEEGYLVFTSGHDEIGRLVVDSITHVLDDGTIYFPSTIEGQAIGIGQVSESESAQTVILNPQAQLIAQALETDESQTINPPGIQTIAITQTLESDSAQAVGRRILIVQASEADTAQSIGRKIAIAQASEIDAAQAIGRRVSIAIAHETDSGQTISLPGAQGIAITQISETDSAQVIIIGRIILGMASENDFAQTINSFVVVEQHLKTTILEPRFIFNELQNSYRIEEVKSFELAELLPYKSVQMGSMYEIKIAA